MTSSASISGRVVNLGAQPLANTTVHLASRSTAPSERVWRIEGTAADGSFRFDTLEPGRYSLLGECAGYHQQQYGSRPGSWNGIDISVDDGEQISNLVFTMSPPGSIAGRITREDGGPLVGILVHALRPMFAQGHRRLFPWGGAHTAPDGSYVIQKLPAGGYYLAAERVFDPSQAKLIELEPGAALHGCDLQIRTRPGYRVRGKLVPPQFAMVQLLALDGMEFERRRNGIPPHSPMDSFEFLDVESGRYAVQASPGQRTFKGVTTQTPAGRLMITVTDSDIDDLVLHLAPALELRGRVTVEGVEPPELLPEPEPPPPSEHPWVVGRMAVRPWITLRSADGVFVNSPSAESREDGTFHIKGIIPGTYRATVTGGFPPGAYLKSIHLGDRDVTDTEFELTSNPPDLHVLLATRAATISGIVRNSNGVPAPGATVTCWEPHRSTTTDQKGAFAIHNLAPGVYRLLAWEPIDDDCAAEIAGDKITCATFEARVIMIALQENSRESIELQAVPRAEMEAAAAKIG